jgi:hypothetical protein
MSDIPSTRANGTSPGERQTARRSRRVPVICLLVVCASVLLLAVHAGLARCSRAAAQAILVAVRDGDRKALESRLWPGYGGKDNCLMQLLEQDSLKSAHWHIGIARLRADENVAVVTFSHPVAVRGKRWEGLRLVLVRDTREGRAMLVREGAEEARLRMDKGKPTGRWLVILAVLVEHDRRFSRTPGTPMGGDK